MGCSFNKLNSESVYELLQIKVRAMDVLGYPESSEICDGFKPAEENACSKERCQFGMRVKYQGKWDIEFRFYYYHKDKTIRASVWFHNLPLGGKCNEATDELRESIRKQFYSKWDWEQFTFDFSVETVVYLAERKIKDVADVGKYVYNFERAWNSKNIIDVLTQFKTKEEWAHVYDFVPEDESVEIDGISLDEL